MPMELLFVTLFGKGGFHSSDYLQNIMYNLFNHFGKTIVKCKYLTPCDDSFNLKLRGVSITQEVPASSSVDLPLPGAILHARLPSLFFSAFILSFHIVRAQITDLNTMVVTHKVRQRHPNSFHMTIKGRYIHQVIWVDNSFRNDG